MLHEHTVIHPHHQSGCLSFSFNSVFMCMNIIFCRLFYTPVKIEKREHDRESSSSFLASLQIKRTRVWTKTHFLRVVQQVKTLKHKMTAQQAIESWNSRDELGEKKMKVKQKQKLLISLDFQSQGNCWVRPALIVIGSRSFNSI